MRNCEIQKRFPWLQIIRRKIWSDRNLRHVLPIICTFCILFRTRLNMIFACSRFLHAVWWQSFVEITR
jgi:hypothetical protein